MSSYILNILRTQKNSIDSRYRLSGIVRKQINKVFPTHWSFLLGEIALYSFIILLISGIWLTLFFDPSMTEVIYDGAYQPLHGIQMSRAYESALQISFEVRGGLFVRQIHHWAALMFAASIIVHMARIFFTGAFRRPRETNWIIGSILLIIAMFEGYFGYSLPDDLLSGIGLRAALSSITLGIPIIGTWLHWMLFGGDFPGEVLIPRLYALHIIVLPGILLLLIAIHMLLVWSQKHTQFPGPGRTENNVVGVRVIPTFALKSGAFFAIITGVLSLMSGLITINPIWNLGPYKPSQVSAGSQPDFYMMWTEGLARIWPAWEIYPFNHTIPAVIWVVLIMSGVFIFMIIYPFFEKRITNDNAHHNLLQRPRDVPVRTAIGAMAIAFYIVLSASAMNDIIALKFNISLNATTWAGRIGMVIMPGIIYCITYRWAIALQRSDREILAHGIETGIIRRSLNGAYTELHQPLGPINEKNHNTVLKYQGVALPKRMNKLGMSGSPDSGSLFFPDPVTEQEALYKREYISKQKTIIALRKIQEKNSNTNNGM